MTIHEMLSSGANMQIVVSLDDLKVFAATLIEEAQRISHPQEEEEMYTPRAFAKRHGVAVSTLWRWCRAGILSPTRIGGKTYYKDSSLKVCEG